MTVVPPQTALAVLMPSIVIPLALFCPPLATICGPFSVLKIPSVAPLPPTCEPGRLLVPPPEACAPSPKDPGASWLSWKTSRPNDGKCCISLLLTTPLLEAVLVDHERKCIWGQSVEVVKTIAVAGAGKHLGSAEVGEGQGGSGDDGAG